MEIEEILGTFDAQAAHDAEWDRLEQVDEFPAKLLLETMKNALKVPTKLQMEFFLYSPVAG